MLKVSLMEIVNGTPAGENTTLYVDPPMTKALVGEIFSINISVADVINLWGYEFKLSYNNTILNATEAFVPEGHFLTPETPGMFFLVEPGIIHQEEGYVCFAGTLLGTEKPKSGNGILGTISFLVTDEGESSLTLFDTTLVNDAIEVIPHDVIDGYFACARPTTDEILIEEVIVPENLTTDLIALKWPEPLQTGDVITPSVFASGLEYVVEPNRTVWFYWINDCPYAMFAHDTRYVFIDAETGECEVVVEKWPPALNGMELWPTPEEYYNASWTFSTATEYYSMYSAKEENRIASKESSVTSAKAILSNSGNQALIIEGAPEGLTGLKDASELWYNLLKKFGYSDDNITYLTPEERDHTDYICTLENVTTAMGILNNTLQQGDNLTIFIIAHGGNYSWCNGYLELASPSELLNDTELADLLSGIQIGVHITVIVESCYSASFMDDLWALENVDIVITSTDWKSVSYTASPILGLDPPEVYKQITDWTWNDTNPEDEGGEFSSGLIEGLEELKEQFINGTITVGELYIKAFKIAEERDAGYQNGDVLKNHYGPKKKPIPRLKTIFFEGDLDFDRSVTIVDITIVAVAWSPEGTSPGHPRWNPIADMDKNRQINIVDITKVAVLHRTHYEAQY